MADFVAITRPVSPSIVRCELTHLVRAPIDYARAQAQHDAYERALEVLGVEVLQIPALPDAPDAVFVEDTAVVLDEVAVITRPGAVSRRAELGTIRAALRSFRTLHEIAGPGTLDGGDVLVSGRRIYVGRSARTNDTGIEQLRAIVVPSGYDVIAVDVHGCLHLKTAACFAADDVLLLNPAWVNLADFQLGEDVTVIEVHPEEPFGANVLRVDETLIYGAQTPRTRERIERL